MSIINTAWSAVRSVYRDPASPPAAMPNELIGDTGFVLRLRREIPTADPSASSFLLGMRIFESPLIPAGHFMLGGQLVRYIKPTLDEMCAEARKRLAVALDADVARHQAEMTSVFIQSIARVCAAGVIAEFVSPYLEGVAQ